MAQGPSVPCYGWEYFLLGGDGTVEDPDNDMVDDD